MNQPCNWHLCSCITCWHPSFVVIRWVPEVGYICGFLVCTWAENIVLTTSAPTHAGTLVVPICNFDTDLGGVVSVYVPGVQYVWWSLVLNRWVTNVDQRPCVSTETVLEQLATADEVNATLDRELPVQFRFGMFRFWSLARRHVLSNFVWAKLIYETKPGRRTSRQTDGAPI